MEEFKFSTIEEAVADLRAGKMIIAVDDPDRENPPSTINNYRCTKILIY